MRTTIDVEDDVLLAAKEIARQRKKSVGKVLSELAREALTQKGQIEEQDGLPLFPIRPNARPVTMELVNRLRDEDG